MQLFKKAFAPKSVRLTPLASSLGLALSLSVASSASMASAWDASGRSPVSATTKAQSSLDPDEVFAQIQKWGREHPLSQTPSRTLGGAVHVVTSCDDSGPGTMRAHIAHAASGDIIDMSSIACFITLNQPIVIPQNSLALKGQFVDNYINTLILLSDSNTAGMIRHTGSGILSMQHLILDGPGDQGSTYANGGCLYSAGSVAVSDSIIQNCEANVSSGALGGAIYAEYNVDLTDSVISDSEALSLNGPAHGGGIYAQGDVSLLRSAVINNHTYAPNNTSRAGGVWAGQGASIKYSTIANNGAELVGGLLVASSGANAKLRASTISGNQAENYPAAYLASNGGFIEVISSTITGNVVTVATNSETAGLEIAGQPSSITLVNNIVSGNENDAQPEGYGPDDLVISTNAPLTSSHNLLGAAQWSPGELPVAISQRDTPLEPLGYNGGPTPTHAIDTGSWAFNMGQASLVNDQRGMPRDVGAGDDIGAFESDALFIGRFEQPPMVED